MAAHSKAANELARQLFRLSLDQGRLSAERVAGVLQYVEKDRPANPVIVLKAYRRLVQAQIAREQAVVEHAGPLSSGVLEEIARTLSEQYRRTITAASQPRPELIAGVRVRIGDDIYESSVAGQLADLEAAL